MPDNCSLGIQNPIKAAVAYILGIETTDIEKIVREPNYLYVIRRISAKWDQDKQQVIYETVTTKVHVNTVQEVLLTNIAWIQGDKVNI